MVSPQIPCPKPTSLILHEQKTAFEGFMAMFKDIRMASVMIADSIRTRELNALRATGLLHESPRSEVENCRSTDPCRCPICLEVFYDNTVASKVCGHGMHEKCADMLLPPGEVSGTSLCGICRAPISREDFVVLRGIVPATDNVSAWKTIILTKPWEYNDSLEEPQSRTTMDGTAERLLIAIQTLFRRQTDFSRAMCHVMQFYKDVNEQNNLENDRLQKYRKNLLQRQRKVVQDEMRLNNNIARQEDMLLTVAQNAFQEESNLLKKRETLIRRQLRMERLNAEFRSNEEDLQNRMKRFDKKYQEGKKELQDLKKELDLKKKEVMSAKGNGTAGTQAPGSSDNAGEVPDPKPLGADVVTMEQSPDFIDLIEPQLTTEETSLNSGSPHAKRLRSK